MATLIAIPIFIGLAIFQSTVVSRIPLLHGTADLVLLALVAWALQERVKTHWQWSIIGGLLISILSAMPFGVLLIGYLMATVIALILRPAYLEGANFSNVHDCLPWHITGACSIDGSSLVGWEPSTLPGSY